MVRTKANRLAHNKLTGYSCEKHFALVAKGNNFHRHYELRVKKVRERED